MTLEHVILEIIIRGTQTGSRWGLPGTGRYIELRCVRFVSFDDEGTLAGERIYYDRATVLRQLGIFREPDQGLGRLLTCIR